MEKLITRISAGDIIRLEHWTEYRTVLDLQYIMRGGLLWAVEIIFEEHIQDDAKEKYEALIKEASTYNIYVDKTGKYDRLNRRNLMTAQIIMRGEEAEKIFCYIGDKIAFKSKRIEEGLLTRSI